MSIVGEHPIKSTQVMPWLAWDPVHVIESMALRQAACVAKFQGPLDLRLSLDEVHLEPARIGINVEFHKAYFSAIRIAMNMASALRPFDRYDDKLAISLVESAPRLQDERDRSPVPTVLSNKLDAVCHFQGIWLGAEQIWIGDLVRVRPPPVSKSDSAHSTDRSLELIKLLNVESIWMNRDRKIRFSGICYRQAKADDKPSLICRNDPALFPSELGPSTGTEPVKPGLKKGPTPRVSAQPESKSLGFVELQQPLDQQFHFSLPCILGRWYPPHCFVGPLAIPPTARRLPRVSSDDMQNHQATRWSWVGRDETYENAIEPLIKGPRQTGR